MLSYTWFCMLHLLLAMGDSHWAWKTFLLLWHWLWFLLMMSLMHFSFCTNWFKLAKTSSFYMSLNLSLVFASSSFDQKVSCLYFMHVLSMISSVSSINYFGSTERSHTWNLCMPPQQSLQNLLSLPKQIQLEGFMHVTYTRSFHSPKSSYLYLHME